MSEARSAGHRLMIVAWAMLAVSFVTFWMANHRLERRVAAQHVLIIALYHEAICLADITLPPCLDERTEETAAAEALGKLP